MENNPFNDNDPEPPPTPKNGGKKTKLNDGSSRDVSDEEVREIKDEENGESSAATHDTIPEEATAATTSGTINTSDLDAGEPEYSILIGPTNEIVIMGPSTSGSPATLLNIKRETQLRSYGKKKPPGERPANADKVKSSNSLVSIEIPSTSRVDTSGDIVQIKSATCGIKLEGNVPIVECTCHDINYERVDWSAPPRVNSSKSTQAPDTPAVLLKERPKHNYFIVKEVHNRELGLSFPRGQVTKEDLLFRDRFTSSLHSVYRMEKLSNLLQHKRCVNSINFNPEGQLLVSGSDDTSVIVWDWARKIPLYTIENAHKSNVFQTKFLYLNSGTQLNIVTCARDGQVKLLQSNNAGGLWSRRRLAGHGKAVNKLYVTPLEPQSVLSAGEDGLVLHTDLRSNTVNKVVYLTRHGGPLGLNSVHGHPLNALELVVAGRDRFVRVFDRRMSTNPCTLYCPTKFTEDPNVTKRTMYLCTLHLSNAVYNHDGSEILSSYSDEDIYIFNTKTDVFNKDDLERKGYSLQFSGHRNSSTAKPAIFYGPRSEYVISGSDCGNMYIWDKRSESIVQWLRADANGGVNTIEAHPVCPILASCGLDRDVKIWMPYSNRDPTFHGMNSTVTSNSSLQWQNPLFNDFLPTLFRSWRSDNPGTDEDVPELPAPDTLEMAGNICTTF